MVGPEYYRGICGKGYIQPTAVGFTQIPVLTFLNGLPWDRLALNYVHALRPGSIRVTTGEVTCDSQSWRVTVCVHKSGGVLIIDSISQEVCVGLDGGFIDGLDLRCRIPEED